MKTGFKYLALLTIIFCSCYENEVLVSEVVESLTAEELAAENTIVLSNLIADVVKLASLSPELNLTSEDGLAEIRNSCPTTYMVSDGIYPDTFFVNFDDCDPSAVFDQNFDGAVMFVLNGALNDPTVCPLFSIKKSPAIPEFVLRIDDSEKLYTVDILNEVDFCLQSDNGDNLKYTYTLDGGVNLLNGVLGGNFFNPSFQQSGVTCYPTGMTGCVTIKTTDHDDINKPKTLVDNMFFVTADPTIIECKFEDGTSETLCVATNPEGIKYSLLCGCPESGRLYINSPATGNCNNIQSTSSFWDYGFIQNPGNSSCENSALDPDNIVQRIPCGQSF